VYILIITLVLILVLFIWVLYSIVKERYQDRDEREKFPEIKDIIDEDQ